MFPTKSLSTWAFDVQAAKTYLERKFEEFPSCDVDALLQHGLKVSYLCHAHLPSQERLTWASL